MGIFDGVRAGLTRPVDVMVERGKELAELGGWQPKRYADRIADIDHAEKAQQDAVIETLRQTVDIDLTAPGVPYRVDAQQLCVEALGIMRSHPDGPPQVLSDRLDVIGRILHGLPEFTPLAAGFRDEEAFRLAAFMIAYDPSRPPYQPH